MKHKTLSKSVRQGVYKRFQGHCAYCGKPIAFSDMQVDHVRSLWQGGDDSIENLRASCRACNFYKGGGDTERLRCELGKIVERLKKTSFIFRLALAYGLISINEKQISFFFERNADL